MQILLPVKSVLGSSGIKEARTDTLQFRLTHLEPGKTQLSNQIWSIAESFSGFVFFAEAEGIVAMRGSEWSLIKTPNSTTVRSLALADRYGKEEIYYGEKDDFGTIIVDSLGNFQALSLKHTIPDSIQFGDVWNTHIVGDDVFFQTRHYLFKYSNSATEIIHSINGFHNSFLSNDRLLIREFGVGLKEYDSKKGLELVSGGELLANQIIVGITSGKNKEIDIWSQDGKIYNQESSRAKLTTRTVYSDRLRDYSKKHRLYVIEKLDHDLFAIGTLGAGLIFVNSDGEIIKALNKSNGFPDPSINYLRKSRYGGLWIALDNEGVVFANNDLGLLKYDRESGLLGYINQVALLNNKMLVSTGRGVFLSKIYEQQSRKSSLIHYTNPIEEEFKQIVTSSSVWNMYDYKNKIYVAGEIGLSIMKESDDGFFLDECQAEGLSQNGIQVQAHVLASSDELDVLFVGLNVGVGIVSDSDENECEYQIIQLGDKIEVRSLIIKNEYLWMGTAAYGVWVAKINSGINEELQLGAFRKTQDHLPGRNDLVLWDDEVVVVNKEQLSAATIGSNGEIKLTKINITGIQDDVVYSNVSPMNNKRAWLILRDSLVQVEKKSTNYFVKAIPDALKFSKSGSSALLISDDGLLWFNDGSTLVRYDSRHHSNTRENFQAYLSKLIISNSGVVFYNGVNRATTGQVVSSRVRNLV